MSRSAKGVLAMFGACVLWGLSPLYFKLLVHIPPEIVLLHRIFWSFVLFTLFLGLTGRMGALRRALRTEARWLALSSVLITCNWFVFIHAITIGVAMQASLGYYIFPLVAVTLGAVVLGERPGRWQWAAVLLAAAGVVVMATGAGGLPWIALLLATTFSLYGLVKRRAASDAIVSVTGEVTILAPVMLAGLLLLDGTAPMADPADAVLLVLSGVVTALPLILFSYAAQRIRYGTLGLIQYLNPTLQFLIAVLVFGEPFGPVHLAAFALIWLALALYSAAGVSASRRASRSAVTVPTEVM